MTSAFVRFVRLSASSSSFIRAAVSVGGNSSRKCSHSCVDQSAVARSFVATVPAALGEPDVDDYFVAGQYDENRIDTLEALENVPVTGAGAKRNLSMPLRNMAKISRTTSQVEATHYNIQRTIDILKT